MEPPVSSPREMAHMEAAMAMAEPLLEPMVSVSRSQGFRGGSPNCQGSPKPEANWVMLVLPISTEPASFIRAMVVASSGGTLADRLREPEVVTTSLVSNWSLAPKGSPWRGCKGVAAHDGFFGKAGVGEGFFLADGYVGIDLGVQLCQCGRCRR